MGPGSLCYCLGPHPVSRLLKQGVLPCKGKDLNTAQNTVTFLYKHVINHVEVFSPQDVAPVPALQPSREFIIYNRFTRVCVPPDQAQIYWWSLLPWLVSHSF